MICDHDGKRCLYKTCDAPAPFFGPLVSEMARPDGNTMPTRACVDHTDGLAFIRSTCCGGTGERIDGLQPWNEFRHDGTGWVPA